MKNGSALASLFVGKLWTFVAIVLVMFALFISALRYSLPYLNDKKPQIQAYVQQQYGIELEIGSINADWSASGPRLVLENVVMQQQDSSPILLDVERLQLVIDFWPTLLNLKLQSKNVELNGLSLTFDVDMMEQSSSGEFTIVTALETVFLEQLANFSVLNSEVIFSHGGNKHDIEIESLSWMNEGTNHNAWGLLSLDNFATESISFSLDLTGDIDNYNGILYARGQQLDISPWVNEFTKLNATLSSSDANFQLWGTIKQNKFEKLRATLLPSELVFDANGSSLPAEFEAEFYATYAANNWSYVIQDFSITTDTTSHASQWFGNWDLNGEVSLMTDDVIQLNDFAPLTALILSESTNDETADLYDIAVHQPYLSFSTENGPAIKIDRIAVNTSERGLLPGIRDLSAQFSWSNNKGLLEVRQDFIELNANTLFGRAVELEQVNFPLFIDNSNGHLELSSDLAFTMDDLAISGEFLYRLDNGLLDLTLETGSFPLQQAKQFFPNKLMGKNTINYLTRAFIGEGTIEEAVIRWNGEVDQFPFKEQQGFFDARIIVTDAEFLFSPSWPAITDLDIELAFVNKGLFMSSPSSRLGNVAITELSADIPSLDNTAVLTIEALGTGTGEQLADLMLNSSLDRSLGAILNDQVVVTGPLRTELSLEIPLSNARELVAKGDVFLEQNTIDINSVGLVLSESNGVISFVNEAIEVEKVNADLFGFPITLGMQSDQNDTYDLNIDINGDWPIKQVMNQYSPGLVDKLDGNVDWALNVLVNLDKQDYQYEANLVSNLANIQSLLPAPLSKSAGETLPLLLTATGDNLASQITMTVGNESKFEGLLPHKERKFSRAHLAFGNSEVFSMGSGFSISANMTEMDALDWFSTVNAITSGIKKGGDSFIGLPQRIFIESEKVKVGERLFTDVNAVTRRNSDNWGVEFDSDQTRGNVTLYDQWSTKGIRIDADYLRLAAVESTQETNESTLNIDPKSLPVINFNCDSCQYADIDFGKVELEAQPNSDGLMISQLLMENDSGRLFAEGQWYKRHSDHYTYLAGNFNSRDIGRYLESFDVDSGIRDSGASLEYVMTWQDAPYDFNFETLNGNIDWELSDGYLSEVSDKGARIFTLLSFNSLVRKLSLDFRDVFAKGFFYDDMQGSIQITDGKADTRDTKIDGAAGEMNIVGYTDLVSNELNYNINFAPNITGNLPVLVYFFTVSPPSALAALAIDQMLTSTKVISNINYSITGTLAEPILIETGRESTDVELPARRNIDEPEQEAPFIPPTEEDLINIR